MLCWFTVKASESIKPTLCNPVSAELHCTPCESEVAAHMLVFLHVVESALWCAHCSKTMGACSSMWSGPTPQAQSPSSTQTPAYRHGTRTMLLASYCVRTALQALCTETTRLSWPGTLRMNLAITAMTQETYSRFAASTVLRLHHLSTAHLSSQHPQCAASALHNISATCNA